MNKPVVSEPSSLDRFLWDRGIALLGFIGGWRGGNLALLINSVVQTCLGIGFTIVGQVWDDPSARVFQILSPISLTIGLVLGVVTVYVRMKSRILPKSEVKLTRDAIQLVYRIMSHIGWQFDQNRFSPGANQWNQWMEHLSLGAIFGRKTSSQMLRPEAFELVDRAAAQFNRASGVYKANKRSGNAAIERIVPAAQAAADEAMISIFNQIAVLERTPESSAALKKQIERDILNLTEMADRVEALAGGPATLTEQFSSTTAMQSVLEQLRYDAQAREELSHPHHSDQEDSEQRHKS